MNRSPGWADLGPDAPDTEDAYGAVFGMHPTPGLVAYDLQGGGSDGEPLALVVGNAGPGEGYEALPGFDQSWTVTPQKRAAEGGPHEPDSEADDWAPASVYYRYLL
ncbi:hypothetical protein ACG83_10560 [Frankia sp. R43]|uniref:hypothetical protein n=1 Tax=Frankia sp. R43 TaxID=269536 RepID=UPI0006CA28C0|nr:hypothetical protein [Frankia sp. R43]KPM55716.1 hypothetical protein ACG83_10560 [Frankia sp. R43]